MGLHFADRISRIPVYPAAGGYDLGDSVALLASNEAPFAPLPAVAAAAAVAVSGANRYPDPTALSLREAISEATGVGTELIATGNGSCDVLLALGDALLQPRRELVYAWPAFSVYPQLAGISGATAVEVPLDPDSRHDLTALAAAVTKSTAMLLICNPNNPTSTLVPVNSIENLLSEVPESVCVVLDEAYREFVTAEAPDATLALLESHPNLVILRTFSKVYGLAALRVGYALCGSAEIRTAVDQVRQPFFCNSAAQAAAIEALRHSDEIGRRVDQVILERSKLIAGLADLGITVSDSEANFVWAKLADGVDEAAIVSGLAERGVLVRAGTALGGPGHLRITVGLEEQHDRLVSALHDLLSER